MALADYAPERVDITYRGKALASVRGLNLEDVTVLMRQHLDELRQVYSLVGANSGKLLPGDTEATILKLISDTPALAAKIIAIASDEPDQIEAARRLSMPLQMKILLEVARLTFEDIGGPLVFAGMMNTMVANLPALPSAAPTIQ